MVLAVLLLITLVVGVVGAASRSARRRTRPALLMSPAATLSPTEQAPVHGIVTADHTATTPANGAEANLRAALDRWRTAGLITDAQAASIEQHELTLLQAARPVPAHDTRRGIPLVAEALGYLGGTLGIVGLTLLVSRYWPDMATAGRLGLSGGAAVLLAGAGYSVHEGADPAFTRLRWFLWLVSSAAGALFAGVLATQTFGADAPATIALACATLIAAQNAVFWAGARRPLQQLLTLTASMVAAGAFVAQFAGSVTVGTALWAAGWAVHEVVGWWIGFLVLTIAGERLELSRFMPPSRRATQLFAAIVAAVLLALLAWLQAWGPRLFGLALLALAVWLLRNDIARRTVRQQGLTRFIAVCLLSGYFWLALGGAVMAVNGLEPGSAPYDAALHALLLGFVFAMVFGHAPIIFPAVLRVAVPYHPGFYAPLVLLHASLVLRIAGDAGGSFELRRWGALLSALALLGFIANTATAVLRGRRSGRRVSRA